MVPMKKLQTSIRNFALILLGTAYVTSFICFILYIHIFVHRLVENEAHVFIDISPCGAPLYFLIVN